MVNTRLQNKDNLDVDVTISVIELKQIIDDIVAARTTVLHDEIQRLERQVKDISDTNKDLIRLLTHNHDSSTKISKGKNNTEIQNINKTDIINEKQANTNRKGMRGTNNQNVLNVENISCKYTADRNLENLSGNKRQSNMKKTEILRGTGDISSIPVGSKNGVDEANVNTVDEVLSFAAVARRAYLYVGNVNLYATEKSLYGYLKQKLPNNNFIVEPLPMRDNAQSRAFKLTCDFSLLESLKNPSIWPNGIVVKRFFRPKTSN